MKSSVGHDLAVVHNASLQKRVVELEFENAALRATIARGLVVVNDHFEERVYETVDDAMRDVRDALAGGASHTRPR